MRYSKTLINTRKEDPIDAELPSHKLLLRAGYIEQLTAGIYTLMPLAWRSIQKIADIIREELNAADAQELLLPMVQPASIWKESTRWDHYGKELLRFKDRKNQEYCLGPTHEEVIVDLARKHIKSYRNMPMNLYQIQDKFRDELRPRGGLMRGREFIMKDAYSFDVNYENAELSYKKMYDAYTRIFKRCGLSFRAVEADSGNIGGSHSHEFQVLAQTGEDRILSCPHCGYAANEEKAELKRQSNNQTPHTDHSTPECCEIYTPNQKSIDEVSTFLKSPPNNFIKTLILLADTKPIAVLLQGNKNLNEIKLQRLINAEEIVMANDTAIREITNADPGFAGPVGLNIPIYADLDILNMHDCITGANKTDTHLLHVEPARDFKITATADLVLAQENDPCPKCDTQLQAFRGIEVGHVFLLGTKYSQPMGATFLDENGNANPIIMGCYGIGLTRILSSAIEQCHDENGIILPLAISPFHVIITPIQTKSEQVMNVAEKLYNDLKKRNIEVLLDDRDQRPGIKFKDADLIGSPYRITIGLNKLEQNLVELKKRTNDENISVNIDEVVDLLEKQINNELQKNTN